jgi:hypothetical protein
MGMPHILHLVCTSVDQLEQHITVVEQSNDELQQQAQKLREVITTTASTVELDNGLCVQAESIVAFFTEILASLAFFPPDHS